MKNKINLIFILILIILVALLSSCAIFDLQENKPEEKELIFSTNNLPRWLLLEHLRIERIEIETDHNEGESDDFSDEIIEPESNSETNSPSEQTAPVKEQSSLEENKDPANGELNISEQREIDRAKEALRKIEEEYKAATNEEKEDLAARYSQIIKQLNTKYGIIYEHKLEKIEWWKIGKDPDPSFHHEVNIKTE